MLILPVNVFPQIIHFFPDSAVASTRSLDCTWKAVLFFREGCSIRWNRKIESVPVNVRTINPGWSHEILLVICSRGVELYMPLHGLHGPNVSLALSHTTDELAPACSIRAVTRGRSDGNRDPWLPAAPSVVLLSRDTALQPAPKELPYPSRSIV